MFLRCFETKSFKVFCFGFSKDAPIIRRFACLLRRFCVFPRCFETKSSETIPKSYICGSKFCFSSPTSLSGLGVEIGL